jgi:uncharacterized membrane protein
MEPAPPIAKPEASSPFLGERFTHRLEAFSDLVFGFSLSLLATRLDLPLKVEDIFEATRWGTFIVTFGAICGIWLAHYRIFRHRFVARAADVGINFIFLFGIAILPYSVQTFLRFMPGQDAMLLYFGDFGLLFLALATMRWRALLQRRGDPDVAVRLKEWRETVRQLVIALVVVFSLLAMRAEWIPREKLTWLVPTAFVVVMVVTRASVKQLPKFLE